MEKWRDKVAVITGASSGIGAALARRLVQRHGMFVVGCARRMDRLLELQASLPAGRFFAIQCDITCEQSIIDAFTHIALQIGCIHVLINNAGSGRLTSLVSPSTEALRTLFATNVVGHLLVTREALRIMRPQIHDASSAANSQCCQIIFTNSVAGHVQTPEAVELINLAHPYMVTKSTLNLLVDGLREELRAAGLARHIRVGQVSPGAVSGTEIVSSVLPRDEEDDNSGIMMSLMQAFASLKPLKMEDVVCAFEFLLAQPVNASVNEVIVRHNN